MNPDDNNEYDPAEDDNQGVVQLMAQQDEASTGVAQTDYMSPAANRGDDEQVSGAKNSGVNDDVLAEEAVETGKINANKQQES